MFVLTGGPWIIAGQYLIIQMWRPDFIPSVEVVKRMAVWLRICGVPIECFNVWAMRKIGGVLRKLLKIDINTNSHARGKFARICVEIDLTNPLEAFIQINNSWYNLEYEGMREICFICGHYGHKRESCTWSVDSGTEKQNVVDSNNDVEKQNVVDSNHDANTTMEQDEIVKEVPIENSAILGSWMQVKPRGRPRKANTKEEVSATAENNVGSRFDILNVQPENSDDTGPFTLILVDMLSAFTKLQRRENLG
ncbi:hypothetical protein ACFX2I_000534 [Malus domestica]